MSRRKTTRKQPRQSGDSPQENRYRLAETATVTGATPAKASTVRVAGETLSPPDSGPRIEYAPRPDYTRVSELTALANVYRFLLDRHERKDVAAKGAEERGELGK